MLDNLTLKDYIRGYFLWATATFFGLYPQYKYNKEWDSFLNKALDKHKGELDYTAHCLILGKMHVWIENAWYTSGHIWGEQGVPQYRPSFKTLIRLHKRADKLLEAHKQKKKEQLTAKYQQLLGE